MAKKPGYTLTQAYEAVSRDYDVLVIGGGNAALCAAMTARESGASVLMLEKSPAEFRGGNSRHARSVRYAHATGNDHVTGSYGENEFLEDLLRATGGETNEELARLCIRESMNLGDWMKARGCVFQPALHGARQLARANAFFLGGGKALLNSYYAAAEHMGVAVVYGAAVQDLVLEDGRVKSAVFTVKGHEHKISARAVVVASGGFQANPDLLAAYWGKAAKNFLVRGTPYDTGEVFQILVNHGVKTIGDLRQGPCVAVDARAPAMDGGIVSRLDCLPFGIVVNKRARRFYDEGEDLWPLRFGLWGRLVAMEDDQAAYALIDSKSIALSMPSVFPPIQADSIAEMAEKLGLDPAELQKTVAAFNAAVQEGTFDPAALDSCRTQGLEPAKTHWARPLDTPPFYGYPLRPGITFTCHGVAVNAEARMFFGEKASPNMFAAGEIMAGTLLGKGYLAGFGMTIGSVFGRIAGREAGSYGNQH